MTPTLARPKVARVAIRVSDVNTRDASRYAQHGYKQRQRKFTRELLSPEVQLESARRLCARMGYFLDEASSLSHLDLDQSGHKKHWKKRPGLTAHLEAARAGLVDVVIFYKVSRIGRNAQEGLEIWDAFKAAGCIVGIAEEQVDDTTASGRLLRTMLLGFAQFQAESQSDDAKATIAARYEEGKTWGRPPAWIRRDEEGNFSLDPASQKAITRLAELRCQPLSHAAICRTLNAEGHRRPDEQYMTERGDAARLWTCPAVSNLLRPLKRLSLRGHFIASKGELRIDNAYPPVLSLELSDRLDAVEELLDDKPLPNLGGKGWKEQGAKRGNRSASTSYLLSGIVFCGTCRGQMNSTSGKDGNGTPTRHYQCGNATAQREEHTREGLSNRIINAEMVETAVRIAIGVVLGPVRMASAEAPLAPARKKVSKRKPVKQDNGTGQPRTLAEIKAAIALVQSAYEDKVYTADETKERLELLRGEMAQRELLDATEHTTRLISAISTNEIAQAAEGAESSPESARLFIRLVASRIEVPKYIPGRKQRPDLRNSPLQRMVRVELRPGLAGLLTNVRAIWVELRRNKWTPRETLPIVWESDTGVLSEIMPSAGSL